MQSVALRGTSGGWVNMNNVWGASWELPNAPAGPLDMRITDPSGNTVRQREIHDRVQGDGCVSGP